MHGQPVVVAVNAIQCSERIHKETDAGARGADHFGERAEALDNQQIDAWHESCVVTLVGEWSLHPDEGRDVSMATDQSFSNVWH